MPALEHLPISKVEAELTANDLMRRGPPNYARQRPSDALRASYEYGIPPELF